LDGAQKVNRRIMRELRHINETDMGHSIIFQRMHESQGARKICTQTEFPSEQIESLGMFARLMTKIGMYQYSLDLR